MLNLGYSGPAKIVLTNGHIREVVIKTIYVNSYHQIITIEDENGIHYNWNNIITIAFANEQSQDIHRI